MEEELIPLRLRFSKTGAIRYISHLDLTRTFHRAFIRAGIGLKMSQGFSPHPKFSFALPLSVGMESLCEIADFTPKENFDPKQIREKLQEQMPAGIEIKSVEERGVKANAIRLASYEISLSPFPQDLTEKAKELFSGDCFVSKKNKKGVLKKINIADGIEEISLSADGKALQIKALLSCGENYLNPALLLQAMAENLPGFPEETEKSIVRTGIFTEKDLPF